MVLVLLLLALVAQLIKPPSPPYRGPAKWHGGSNNKPIRRLIVHATAGAEPGVKGAAEGTIEYSKHTSRPSSFHYVYDALARLQYVYDSIVAYGDGRNTHELHFEICCSLSNSGEGHWADAAHQAAMKLSAKDIAQAALAYGVPITKLDYHQVRADAAGIAGHNDVRLAFPSATSHWDPGPYFPWPAFIDLVKQAAHDLQDKPPAPAREHKGANRFATFNEKSFPVMPLDNVREDVPKAAALTGVLLWQEIAPAGYKAVVASLSAQGFQTVQLDTECPISFRTDVWELVKDGRKVTHGGMPKVSPYRVFTWALLRHRKTGALVKVVNEHMVSAAWSPRSVAAKAWRKLMWKLHFHKERRFIRHTVNKEHVSVVVGGDDNRSEAAMPKWHARQVTVTHDGIDHLAVVEAEGGARLTVVDSETVPGWKSDHDLKRAWVKVEAPAAA